jgi:thiol-disulfide isomerase/thioredoxin
MKYILIICTLAISLQAVAQKKGKKNTPAPEGKPFTINGTALGVSTGKMVFNNITNRGKKDTIDIVNGKFTYTNYMPINEPAEIYSFQRAEDPQDNIVFVTPNAMDMQINYNGGKGFGITNSIAQESFNRFNTLIMPLVEARTNIMKAIQGKTNDSLQQLQAANEADIQKAFNGFMASTTEHPTVQGFIALQNVESAQGQVSEKLNALVNSMPEPAKLTKYGKLGIQMLNRSTADEIGKIAPDFTLKDSAGKAVTLSQYRGKSYVLVDFWATWCGPCRAEFPELMKAQDKYGKKGLVILGVSIDSDYKKWKDMLAKPGFTNWVHVWDGPAGPDQVVSTLYSVPTIPRNFLLDKNGKVIARNLRGAAVDAKLQELLK